jgi:hypothetical protein
MNKGWKAAPWSIKLIFIYWLVPIVVFAFVLSYAAITYSQLEINGLWRIPIEILKAEYELMPINTTIDIVLLLMTILGAYYGWRLLKGSGFARAVLEVFSWLLVIISIVSLLFPQVQYFELESVPSQLNDIPAIWLYVGWILVLVEALVLIMLRTRIVKHYSDIF